MTTLLVSGSFATIWLALWLLSSLVLALLFPLLRSFLSKLHPAPASSILLLTFAFPLLLSLGTTVLLFIPDVEDSLVTAHCHTDCAAHLPLLSSPYVGGLGLILLSGLCLLLTCRLIENLRLSRALMSQLSPLSEQQGLWHLLPQQQPLVFILGWWKSRIFLTRGLQQQCEQQDLDIILKHEQAHATRHDNIRLLLGKLLLLPVPTLFAKSMYEHLHLLTESACDFSAAHSYDTLQIAETLLRIQRLVPQQFELGKQIHASAFTGAEVETRIRLLVDGKEESIRARIAPLLCLLALLLLSIALVDPMHHSIEWLLGAQETQLPIRP